MSMLHVIHLGELISLSIYFFFNDTATTEIYTLSLHDALPIFAGKPGQCSRAGAQLDPRPTTVKSRRCRAKPHRCPVHRAQRSGRSEEHTSELQSRQYLVCRLLLEKKKNLDNKIITTTY